MKRKPAAGFTLIEALVVISITAILVAIGVPSFRNFVAGRAVTAQVNELAVTLRLARTEAIKRGTLVTVCRSEDPEGDTPTCSGDGDWSSGWIAFVDRATRGQFDEGDMIIRVQSAFDNSGGITRAGGAVISYWPSGVARAAAGNFMFRPRLDAGDANFETLSRRMCTSMVGATRLAEGGAC